MYFLESRTICFENVENLSSNIYLDIYFVVRAFVDGVKALFRLIRFPIITNSICLLSSRGAKGHNMFGVCVTHLYLRLG